VIVEHAAGLEKRLHDRRADEREAALAQVPAHRIGKRRRRRDLLAGRVAAIARTAVDEGPQVGGERVVLALHGEKRLCVVHRRENLAAMPYDAGVVHRGLDRRRIQCGDGRRIEALEDSPVAVALAQDRRPTQARLRALERKQFEEHAVVANRYAPLTIVIAEFGLR